MLIGFCGVYCFFELKDKVVLEGVEIMFGVSLFVYRLIGNVLVNMCYFVVLFW